MNYHRLNVLKEHACISWKSWGSEVWEEFQGVKCRAGRGHIPVREALGETVFMLPSCQRLPTFSGCGLFPSSKPVPTTLREPASLSHAATSLVVTLGVPLPHLRTLVIVLGASE